MDSHEELLASKCKPVQGSFVALLELQPKTSARRGYDACRTRLLSFRTTNASVSSSSTLPRRASSPLSVKKALSKHTRRT